MKACGEEVVVFLGPSLDSAAAASVLPATFFPPAKQSDILHAVDRIAPHTLVLIDGEFGQSLSVWHKELLYALEHGIRVIGASSMGALRAAELEPYGMIGVGEICAAYRDGFVTDDDEVALVYAPAELGYANLSLPFVNVRKTLETAQAQHLLDAAVVRAALAEIKRIHFAARDLGAIEAVLARSTLAASTVAALLDVLGRQYVDQKRADALEALRYAAQPAAASGKKSWSLQRTYSLSVQLQQDMPVNRGGQVVRTRRIAKYASLHHPGFEHLALQAANRKLAQTLANVIGVHPTQEDVASEAARFRLKRRLTDDGALAAWLAANDLTAARFDELMRSLAVCRRLGRWLTENEGRRENTQSVLDELRINGQYPEWADKAAAYEEFAQTAAPDPQEASLSALVRQHLSSSDWDINVDLETWLGEACYIDIAELSEDLALAQRMRTQALGLVSDGNKDCSK